MANWYWKENNERRGPISSKELVALATAQRITPQTLIFKEGATDWVPASKVKGLFDGQSNVDGPPPFPEASTEPSANGSVFGAARVRASLLMRDLRSLNWREEIIPIDESNLRVLIRDYVFWAVVLAGIVPELIGTISDPGVRLTLFAFLFAAMWGVAFRDFIVRAPVKWSWLIGSALFTGLIGMRILASVDHILPDSYVSMPKSSDVVVKLAGSVMHTGVLEELCKSIPVLIYLVWKRKNAEPMTAILIGVFSGLGFAAFENLGYGKLAVVNSYIQSVLSDSFKGHESGVQSAISNTLLRSLSDVFGHAVLSGIVAYFYVIGFSRRWQLPVFPAVGLGLAAMLHGCYNWLESLQATFATFVDVGAFTLFYAYVTKLRNLASGTSSEASPDVRTVISEPPGSNGNAQRQAATIVKP
jgi:RsiW-degrading membrane proteinase PrsW (M82 family)